MKGTENLMRDSLYPYGAYQGPSTRFPSPFLLWQLLYIDVETEALGALASKMLLFRYALLWSEVPLQVNENVPLKCRLPIEV